jgi:MFS superfamily sulfate permease-like transporter
MYFTLTVFFRLFLRPVDNIWFGVCISSVVLLRMRPKMVVVMVVTVGSDTYKKDISKKGKQML